MFSQNFLKNTYESTQFFTLIPNMILFSNQTADFRVKKVSKGLQYHRTYILRPVHLHVPQMNNSWSFYTSRSMTNKTFLKRKNRICSKLILPGIVRSFFAFIRYVYIEAVHDLIFPLNENSSLEIKLGCHMYSIKMKLKTGWFISSCPNKPS